MGRMCLRVRGADMESDRGLWKGGRAGSEGSAPFQELGISRYFHPHPHPLLALREGGVAGVEGGLAPKERCLPPPGRQKEGGSDLRA